MNVFVDANIIVSVLNKEYPLFTYTARIVSLADNTHYKIYTSPICLAIAFYFAEKKYKTVVAKQKISLLCDHINVTTSGPAAVKSCLQNKAIRDFEDGLEYYAALESNCQCIVTEDIHDFYFSGIEVLNSHDFFLTYMAGQNKPRKQ